MGTKTILFVIDELEYKWFEDNKLVTNFWFIKEFLKRDLCVDVATKGMLYVKNAKGCVMSNAVELMNDGEIVYDKTAHHKLIESYDAVFFRPDPPVDIDYINACAVFEFVDRTKTRLINDPLAIRDFNEKMHVNLFAQFVPENIVTASKELILNFVDEYERAVIKPLNRCFGSGVFLLNKGDSNLSSIIAAATENGKTSVMVQQYLSGAKRGDKRVLLVGGRVLDECVRKLPAPNDFKFAEHSDRFFEKSELNEEERAAAQAIALNLSERGLPLVGLDMIDSKVIEINVTSPCFFIKEINALFGINFEDKLIPQVLSLAGIEQVLSV